MSNYGYYRPGLPFVVKNLIIINAIVFIATMFAQQFMYQTFSLFYFTSPFFKPFQLITYMFMHGGFWHIFFNMFSLYMFGSVLENYWGGKKFFLFYMVCGIGAGLINELVMYLQIAFAETPGIVEAAINRVPTVGASGAIYGLLLAYGMMFPNNVIQFIFPPIALKAKWMVIIFGAIELLSGLTGRGGNIAHFAHLGGMLFGIIMILIIKFFSISYKVVATVFCLLLYLSYASVLIDPAVLPIAGFFGLYFIPVLLINILLLLIALLRRSSSAWISLAAIAPAFVFAGSFFRICGHEPDITDTGGIKVLTWNVGGFRAGDGTSRQNMEDVVSLIETEMPQIVSLQEFRVRDTASIQDIFPGYRYRTHHFYRLRNGDFVGNVTLSTLPMRESGHIYFPRSTNNNISIVSIIKKIGRGYDEFSHEFAQAHEKVKKSSSRRGSQVRALLDNISESGLPAVICGDVNDTPVSYCFRSLRHGRKDTFREAGKGFGATYRILWPLLRIDYVFVPESAGVLAHRTLRLDCSDHYPVIAEITMNE